MGDKPAATNPMKSFIDKELASSKAEEIIELLLDNCKSAQIVGFDGHNFERLNHLSFISCDIESLDGLPTLPLVRVCDLSENKISDISQLTKSTPNLYHLNLCGNKFEKLEQLKPLGELHNLQALDIFDCPITETDGYREKLFESIPSLKYLDGFDVNNEEADDLHIGDSEDAEDMSEGFEEEEDAELDEEDAAIGLEYLNSSKVHDDDSSADFKGEGEKTNGKTTTTIAAAAKSTNKRKIDDKGDVPEKTTKKET